MYIHEASLLTLALPGLASLAVPESRLTALVDVGVIEEIRFAEAGWDPSRIKSIDLCQVESR